MTITLSSLKALFLLIGVLCLFAAGLNASVGPRVNFGWLGLTFIAAGEFLL